MRRRVQAMIESIDQVGTLNMSDDQRQHYEELKEIAHKLEGGIHTNYAIPESDNEYYINVPPGSVVPEDWTILPVESDKNINRLRLNRVDTAELRHLRNPRVRRTNTDTDT